MSKNKKKGGGVQSCRYRIVITVQNEDSRQGVRDIEVTLHKNARSAAAATINTDSYGLAEFTHEQIVPLNTAQVVVRVKLGDELFNLHEVGHDATYSPVATDEQNVERNDGIAVFTVRPVRFGIVGGGAAGLAAAYALLEAGLAVVLLEARTRLGGRAFTNTSAGVPFDEGCHWLHPCEPGPHPWILVHELLTREKAVDYVLHEAAERAYVVYDGARADGEAGEKLIDIAGDIGLAFVMAGQKDVPAVTVMKKIRQNTKPYNNGNITTPGLIRMAAAMEGSLDEGVELDKFSIADKSRGPDEEDEKKDRCGANDVPAQGFGRLIADFGAWLKKKFGQKLEVGLQKVVTEIDFRASKRVTIIHGGGRAVVRSVIVTVPVPIAHRLSYKPSLSSEINAAFRKLPMGNLKKVLLRFDADIFDDDSKEIYPYEPNGTQVWRFVTREPANDCITAFAGGTFAATLDAQTDATVVNAAIAALETMLGVNNLAGRLQHSIVTHWGTDPYSLGAYSYGVPDSSGSDARTVLADAEVGDHQLLFAGEAVNKYEYANAHAAYQSGEAAAKKLIAAFGKAG